MEGPTDRSVDPSVDPSVDRSAGTATPANGAPALLAVAHGSPDQQAGRVLDALLNRIRRTRPELTAELAYLGHTEPDVPAALRDLASRGAAAVVVVPLLLSSAFHARFDLPKVLVDFRAAHPELDLVQSAVLGPDERLLRLLRRRLREAAADPAATVVLGAVGTSHESANAELAAVAVRLGMVVGYAAGEPYAADVVDRLRAERGGQVAIATYTLAPGILPDRFAAAGADTVSAPLGDAPEVAAVVLDRFDTAAERPGADHAAATPAGACNGSVARSDFPPANAT